MKRLTKKENEIMEVFWREGPLFVKELLEHYKEPKPHINTLSTMTRILESNGFLSHKAYGNSFRYYPAITKEEYGKSSLNGIITNLFENSYLDAVSAMVKAEKISVDELKELISQIENGSNKG